MNLLSRRVNNKNSINKIDKLKPDSSNNNIEIGIRNEEIRRSKTLYLVINVSNFFGIK